MKKQTCSFILFACISSITAQSDIHTLHVRDHSNANQPSYQVFRIERLDVAINDGKFQKALKQQGVIGNDFFGDIEIGKAKANNSLGTPTDYYPVDGFKRTFCGPVLQQYIYDGIIDKDLNIQIACNTDNELWKQNFTIIKNTSRNEYPSSFIEGEIDFDSGSRIFFDPQNGRFESPLIYNTNVCLYGPWIEEIYDHSEDFNPNKDHVDVHEIHPTEQFWWSKKINTFTSQYYLCAALDASGRFDNSGLFSNFDTDNGPLKQVWVINPMKTVFAIAFNIRLHSPTHSYTIQTITAKDMVPDQDDGKSHFLVYKGDTIIKVNEPLGAEIMNINFEHVGLDAYSMLQSTPDSVLSGFLLIKSNLTNNGNFKLMVRKDIPAIAQVLPPSTTSQTKGAAEPTKGQSLEEIAQSQSIKKIRIKLEEIKCLENSFSTFFGPTPFPSIAGYITIKIIDDAHKIHPDSKKIESIYDKNNVLLFPTNDSNIRDNKRVLHLKKGQSQGYVFASSVVSVKSSQKLEIRTDFVASSEASSIKTLELIEGEPYYSLPIDINRLIKGQPVEKTITLSNQKLEGEVAKHCILQIKLSIEQIE
ncbi:MAG: hypothetical protein IPL92_01675 [Saprospiraceae bacterium]|nr:hypothetical protein [Candidatus Opimibacter iunctus]